jgi:hypothetical protein
MSTIEYHLMVEYAKYLLHRIRYELTKNDLERCLEKASNHSEIENIERDYWRNTPRLIA